MKVQEIQNAYRKLAGLKEKKLPIKMSFVVSRNLKKMEEVNNDVEEKRNELIEKYGKRKEDGSLDVEENGNIKITKPNEFIAELTELLDVEMDMAFEKITESDIEKCDTDGYDKLTVDEVGALAFMTDTGEPE